VKTLSGVLVLSLARTACARKSTPASTPAPGAGAANTAAGGATSQAAPPAGRGAGAQAAARLTPDDLDARMKTAGTTSASLRMKLMNNALADAAKDAQTLAVAFGDVERFFQQHNKSDAVMWAQQARRAAQEAAGAATAGDATKATTAATALQANCRQCHAVYREGDAQTGYRIKTGTIVQ
jgi:hypothetical protein